MNYHPLDSSGKITITDIHREKGHCGPTETPSAPNLYTLEQLALGDAVGGDGVALNTLNPSYIIDRIQTKPYSLSDWYEYDHSLTDVITTGYHDISVGIITDMYKTIQEISMNMGVHEDNIRALCAEVNTGNADSATGGLTYAEPYVRTLVDNEYYAGVQPYYSAQDYRADYGVSIKRSFFTLDVSAEDADSVERVMIYLNGHTPSSSFNERGRAVLRIYSDDVASVGVSAFNETDGINISDVVDFVEGTDANVFTLNSTGVYLFKQAINSVNKKFHFCLRIYEYDNYVRPYFGENQIISKDENMTSDCNWENAELAYSPVITKGYDDSDYISGETETLKVDTDSASFAYFKVSESYWENPFAGSTWYMSGINYRFVDCVASSFQPECIMSIDGRVIRWRAGNFKMYLMTEDTGYNSYWQGITGYVTNFHTQDSGYNDGMVISLKRTYGTIIVDDAFLYKMIFSSTMGNKYSFSKCRVYTES
jgi:hypothetical protein